MKPQIERIFMKLDLRDRTQAVIFAYNSGPVEPGRLWRLQLPGRWRYHCGVNSLPLISPWSGPKVPSPGRRPLPAPALRFPHDLD